MFKWLGRVFPTGDKPAPVAIETKSSAQMAADVNGTAAEERKTCGNVHFSKGELDSAAACYRQAIKLNPDYAEAHNNLGLVFREQKQYVEAENNLKQAAILNPQLANAHYNLGLVTQEQNRPDEALAHYKKALDIRPDYAEAWEARGNLLYVAGRTEEAATAFQRVITLKPDEAVAYFSLGNLRLDQNKSDEAVKCFAKAVALRPVYTEAYFALGIGCERLKQYLDAIGAYKQAIALNPEYADAYNNLAGIYLNQGKLEESLDCNRKLLALKPDYAAGHNNLGLIYQTQGKLDEALPCYRRALALQPNMAVAHNNLGYVLKIQGKLEDSLACFRKALTLNPNYADPYNNRGLVYLAQGKFDDALSCYRKALSLNPELAAAHNNIGNILRLQGKLDESAVCYRKALSLKPDNAEVYNNLGLVFHAQGKLEESLDCYRNALKLKSNYLDANSNLLLALNYYFGITPQELYDEHRNFAKQCEAQFIENRLPHINSRDPTRKLRLAYISADFCRHSVAYFIEPLLVHRDRRQFDITCYYNKHISDDVTRRLQSYVDTWRNIDGISTVNVAELIRADNIDILVDLSGHTGGNRLPVFACKPAPLQVTWLGYPNTTGLSMMDYRITDIYAEPEGMTEHLNTEKLYRLPEVFCSYRPKEGCPAPADAVPAFQNGYITFGCFNNFAKVSPPSIELWSQILKSIPGAKLLLESPGLSDAEFRQVVFERFWNCGVKPEQLELLERIPANQYRLYHRVDICLDPFPCNGGTTSCDALWMGTPLVSLAGNTFASRMGVSLLSNIGLPELIAQTPEEYVATATKLASDLDYLRKIRHGLRERVAKSPLLDMPGFTRQMEIAYREMWIKWCANG